MNEVMNSVNNVIMDNFHKTDNILMMFKLL